MPTPRIGIFVCHCGLNIERTVDTAAVAEALQDYPGVVHVEDYDYMCSDPGQIRIKDAIAEHRLTGGVVAACSPAMHEPTFRRAAEEAGLNPYLFEMANIREHCSWVHHDREERRERRSGSPRRSSRRSRGTTRSSRSRSTTPRSAS